MLAAVVAWCARQYGARLAPEDLTEVASVMLDKYYSDPEYYGGIELRRLADAVNADELAQRLENL